MRVIDFLKIFDGVLPVRYYPRNEDTFLWEGLLYDTPWWIADLPLVNVDYRENFKGEKPGLVVIVEEE